MADTPIINQPWEDVSADVCSAIQAAVQPLLKKAVDDIYGGLLDTTQDYLTENLAFNIASRIDTAEREARNTRYALSDLLKAADKVANGWLVDEREDRSLCMSDEHHEAICALFDAIDAAKARGAA